MKHAHPLLNRLAGEADQVGRALARRLEDLAEDAAARSALDAVCAAGLTAWLVPRSHGGADASALAGGEPISVQAVCALREALAYHSGLLDVMFVMQGLGSFALSSSDNERLKQDLLPQVMDGRAVAAVALTEPEAGSDLGGVETRAERRGSQWRLSGHKTFISNAPLADFFTVLARTADSPREAMTMFLVPARQTGVKVERFEVSAPHPIGEVRFEAVELSDAHRLGPVGAGLEQAFGVLGRFRTSVAAAACGMARRALDASLEHLKSRRQFGKPLIANQALRFDVAEMDARLRCAQLLVEEAARLLDQGQRAGREVARAKLVGTETAWWICDRAVQHFGGLGVRKGNVAERLAREVRALRIYEGTSEIQKLILARELVDEAKS